MLPYTQNYWVFTRGCDVVGKASIGGSRGNDQETLSLVPKESPASIFCISKALTGTYSNRDYFLLSYQFLNDFPNLYSLGASRVTMCQRDQKNLMCSPKCLGLLPKHFVGQWPGKGSVLHCPSTSGPHQN